MEVSEKLKRLLSKKKRRHSNYSEEEEDYNNASKLDQQLTISCRQFFNQKIEFHCVSTSDSHLEELKSRYKPLNPLVPGSSAVAMNHRGKEGTGEDGSEGGSSSPTRDDIPKAKKDIFDSKNLVMEWTKARGIGAGLCNMGNTCFLNSILQCLVYTPPLYNYITSPEHKQKCRIQGFCAMCELHRHATRVFSSQGSCVKPVPIVQNLKAIAKQFRQGRQEDAHEFLRYFVDGLQKSSIHGLPPKLDPHTKATTVVHKIFGGYHRSQVKCLICMKTSDTFDPLLDINLDIKNCSSLTTALQKSIQVDTLDGENSYACPFCKKMTKAQKRYTVHRLPNVLTIQLKRFEYNGMFGGKINKSINYSEFVNMRPYMSSPKGPSEWYRLYGVLIHFGYSSHSGHYYCYVRNSNKVWYCMNDTQVTQVGLSTVLSQEAYLLFYIKDATHNPPEVKTPSKNSVSHHHPPPRSQTSTSTKVKLDPNFLGTAIKRTSPQQACLDKTSAVPPAMPTTPQQQQDKPRVKAKLKPTGIVTPSPHSSVNPPSPVPIKSPPPPSPVPIKSPPPRVSPIIPSPSGSKNKIGKTHENAIEGVRNFSIPLRKTPFPSLTSDSPHETKEEKDAPQDPSSPAQPSNSEPAVKEKEEKKPLTLATPFFTPRQIVAPPKSKKIVKTKRSLSSSEPPQKRVVLEEITRLIPVVKTIGGTEQEHKPSSPPPPEKTISDIPSSDKDSTEVKAKPSQPCFVALSEQATPNSQPTFLVDGEGPPVETTQSPSFFPHHLTLTPFSLKQKIAMVSPLPHSGMGTKPVARVKPNPHLSPSGTKDTTGKAREGAIPSTPHINAVSPWTVTPKSPNIPDRNYDSTAHGWKVTLHRSSTSESDHVTRLASSSKLKKSKKRKKYRNYSPSDYSSSSSEEESDHRSSRKRREKYYEAAGSSRKKSRRDYSDEEEEEEEEEYYSRHNRSREGMSGRERERVHSSGYHHHVGGKKHKKSHRRHISEHGASSFLERKRPREKESRKMSRYSHRSEDRTPPTSSDSEREGRSRYRRERDQHKYSSEEKRRRSMESSRKHHKHKSHHSSPSGEERRRERKRQNYDDRHDNDHSDTSVDVSKHSIKKKSRAQDSDPHRKDETKKKLTPVLEVVWDAGGAGKGVVKGGASWDGAKRNTTVDQLIGHSADQLGTQVRSWDGEENTIDSSTIDVDKKGGGLVRDSWDKELDMGKVKKIKKVPKDNFSSIKNPFQTFQSKKNKLNQSSNT